MLMIISKGLKDKKQYKKANKKISKPAKKLAHKLKLKTKPKVPKIVKTNSAMSRKNEEASPENKELDP